MALTHKQEAFCMAYIENNGNASDAYRTAYDTENMKPETINRRAFDVLSDGKIKARLEELRRPIMEKHRITVESLIAELEEARAIALSAETPQSAAAIQATMGKAKLCGLDKQVMEHTGKDGGPIKHEVKVTAVDDFARILEEYDDKQ